MAKEYQEQQDKLSEQSTCLDKWLEDKKINTIKKLCANDDFYQYLLDITDKDYTGAQQVMKYLEKAL